MLELLFVLAIVALLAAIVVPEGTAGLDATRTAAAARYLAARFASARTVAVARNTNVGVLFRGGSNGVSLGTYRDGNGNGIRTAEISGGTDPAVEVPLNLSDLFPGVTFAVNSPSPDLASGATAVMSFSAIGTSSSGTIYCRGRSGSQYAVRVLGATGRTRVLRFVPSRSLWIETY